MNRKLIAAIVVLIAGVLGLHFWAEWEKARFDASLPTPPAEEEQQSIDETADDTVGDTGGGHWHGDEWHAEPHTGVVMPINKVAPIGGNATRGTDAPYVPYIPSENPALAEFYQMLNADTPEGADLRNSPFGTYLREHEAWYRKEAALYAEEAALDEEEEALGVNDFDAFIKNLDRLGAEERKSLAEKLESLMQKREALVERKRAHRAARPIEPPHGREQ